MKKKPSIFQTFLYSMITVSIFSILIIGYLWISHEYGNFKKESVNLREKFMDQKKQLIKSEVEKAVEYINFKKDLTRERLRHDIKLRVLEAHKIAQFIYETKKDTLTQDQIKNTIIDALRTVRFFDNRNYYFIDDLKGNSIMYPPKPAFEGKNLLSIVNKAGVKPFPDIIRLVKTHGEGYYIYNWVKYTEGKKPTDKEFPKITYFKHFKPFNWFIAVGEYLDYVEDDIRKEIFNRIANINFGYNGSIMLTSLKGQTIVSDNQVWDPPKKVQKVTDSTGDNILAMRKKASSKKEGDYFQFSVKKQTENLVSRQIFFTKAMPELGFIVEAAQPIDEIDNMIAINRSQLFMETKKNIITIILTSMVLIMLAVFFAKYFSGKTKTNFEIFRQFFKKASSESASIKSEALNFQEFSDLANAANVMIDARHKAEMALKQLHEDLEEKVADRTIQLSEANKELDAFAYSVSHDLRAPLRGIDGFSLALMEDFEDTLDDDAKDYLNRIRGGCVRMGQLIDDMLKLSRLSRGKINKESLDLSFMVKEILERLKSSQPDRDVTIDVMDSIKTQGDATLVRAVLENLLGNAWKFTSKTENALIAFGAREKEGQTELFVKDNGAGFDMAYADKLFSAFQRLHTPQEFEGTGIGLATVQRIVHRHGGSVTAEGDVGKGATFYFTL